MGAGQREESSAGGVDPDGRLRSLVAAGDAAAVERLLAEAPPGLDVDRRDARGRTALHDAAEAGNAEIVALLLAAGARDWVEDCDSRTPVDFARASAEAGAGDPGRAEALSLLTEVRFGDEGLREAVAALDAGDVERLRALLRDDPDLVRRRAVGGDAVSRGYFARPALLHFVAGNPVRGEALPARLVEATEAILDAGAEVDAATEGGSSHTTLALVASSRLAYEAGLVEALLELLVARGADPSRGLEAAVLHRRAETARLLVSLGAAHTPASAAALGEVPALRRLLAAGAPAEALQRAAWAAVVNGQAETLDLPLAAGVDPNARLPRPFHPRLLHEAAWFGHREIVDLLLARGADPTLRDTQYHGTPADWARHAGHGELAATLDAAAAAWPPPAPA